MPHTVVWLPLKILKKSTYSKIILLKRLETILTNIKMRVLMKIVGNIPSLLKTNKQASY